MRKVSVAFSFLQQISDDYARKAKKKTSKKIKV